MCVEEMFHVKPIKTNKHQDIFKYKLKVKIPAFITGRLNGMNSKNYKMFMKS